MTNKIVSSLTDEEIDEIYYREDDLRHIAFRRIANAAAKRAIEDLKVPSRVWFINLSKIPKKLTTFEIIMEYLVDVKLGKLRLTPEE